MTGTLLALSAAAAPVAHSEEAKPEEKKKADGTTELPEMVVKADGTKTYKTDKLESKKYTVPLRDVPQTVTVIPNQVIEEQSATTLTEVLRNIPGITMTGGENGNAGAVAGDSIMMRGFDATSSIFMDGVRDNSLASRDTFNMESAEVFLGPTGTDVGRGNAAGYINQVTKSAHLGNEYEAGAQFASGNRTRLTMDLNQDLSALPGDQCWLTGTAVRLNGVYQYGGVAGRDFIERNIWGLAPTVTFGLGTDIRATLAYQHLEQDNIPDYGLPANRNVIPEGVDSEWFYGSDYDYENIYQDTSTARFEWDVTEKFRLSNQTRFNDTERDSVGVRPAYNLNPAQPLNFGKVTRTYVAGDRENSILSNITTATYELETGIVKQTFVGVVDYTKEKQFTYTLAGAGTFTPIQPGQSPNHNVPGNFVDFDRNDFAIGHGETETVGISLFDTIEIGKQWILSGGMRLDSYDSSYNSVNATNVPNPVGGGTFDSSDDLYSGKVGLTFKPVEEGSIYFAYSNTKTPPGTSNFALNDTATSSASINADPQKSENFELGSKWDFFDSKLSLTGALFYTENTNFIYVEDVGPPAIYANDGGQKIKGATIGATGQITENWAILGGITYLDGTVDQPGNVIDGNELSRTPDWAASLWTTYKLPKGFTVGLGMRCQDMVNTTTADGAPTMPGYAVFDGLVQYDLNEKVNFRLNVYNLLDTEYIASTSGGGGGDGGGTGGSTGGGVDLSGNRVMMGAPISFALSANVKF